MKRTTGVSALILLLSAQAASAYAPGAAANEARAVRPEAVAAKSTRLVMADPSWDAFVFASAATAVAMAVSDPADAVPAREGSSWAFLAAEPHFDYLAALQDVGLVQPDIHEHDWLS
jgi:hypothetical protein